MFRFYPPNWLLKRYGSGFDLKRPQSRLRRGGGFHFRYNKTPQTALGIPNLKLAIFVVRNGHFGLLNECLVVLSLLISFPRATAQGPPFLS
jgi:hypothetical protein